MTLHGMKQDSKLYLGRSARPPEFYGVLAGFLGTNIRTEKALH